MAQRSLFLVAWLFGCAASATPGADLLQRDDVRKFIQEMVDRNGFAASELEAIFGKAAISSSILKAAAAPAEAKPWFRYRPIFLQPERVELGVEFWRENEQALRSAAEAYGVPEEIIVGIIGVETRYGRNAGSFRVVDALTTLAFDYPPRAEFFRAELEQFLLLTRDHNLDALAVKGSYAGAMGIPQFISSSYRRYAVDFDIDGITDIWASPVDAIGSVANYFKRHGWQRGGLVALPLAVGQDQDIPAPAQPLEPDLEAADLERIGIAPPLPLPAGEKVKLIRLELESGSEYWLAYWNFYVITRYNHSAQYAMAVFQLAQEIRAQFDAARRAPAPAAEPS